jgi:GSH-dependent disulfide-bond oxidoreductase
MIDLYYWSTANGWKITIMLEECKLPYNLIPVDIRQGEQFKPDFLKLNPNNRIPAIVDKDPIGLDGPIAVFESGAILEYLAEKTGKFMPADLRGRYDVKQWVAWQIAGLGPMAGQKNHFRYYAPEKIEYAIDRYSKEVDRLCGVLDKQLAERVYICGDDYTIADIASWSWLSIYERLGVDIANFGHLSRWLEAIRLRPAVQRGISILKEARPGPSAGVKTVDASARP